MKYAFIQAYRPVFSIRAMCPLPARLLHRNDRQGWSACSSKRVLRLVKVTAQ